MTKKICIIPARGGSKRIPRKNLKLFLGKPIITYGIEAALNSDLFDEVMVSTDDEEIASIAREAGANVPFMRSKKNSDDYAGTVDVLIEVLERYRQIDKYFDFGCCIYPTAPFIKPEIILTTFEKLLKNNFDSIFPILPFSYPIQRAIKITSSGKIEFFSPEYLPTRSQDLESAYHDSGQFYWFKIETLLKQKNILTSNTGALVLSEMEAHDIDNLEDWKIAEYKYQFLKNDNLN